MTNMIETLLRLKKEADNVVDVLYQGYQTLSQNLNERIYENYNKEEDSEPLKEEKSNEYYFLRETMINKLWQLPELLRQYGITENEITHVLGKNPVKQFEMDANRLSLIYGNIMEDFSAKTQYEMGIIDEDGNLRINPVNFCYKTNTKEENDLNVINKVNEYFENEQKETRLGFLKNQITVLREKISSNSAVDAENKLFVKLIKEYFAININDKIISSLEELQQDEYYNYLSFSDKIDIERYLFNS